VVENSSIFPSTCPYQTSLTKLSNTTIHIMNDRLIDLFCDIHIELTLAIFLATCLAEQI